ncbi:MAG: ferritin family protein [Deltaproteobacteria bacterium]|jgi:rubrerythrin|nr:ferritin family protein [Deltaproteobacteria bacterium]
MIYPFNAAEALKIALSIEENGLKFYQEAARRFAGPTADLFTKLAGEEVAHKALFQKMLDTLPKDASPTVFDPDNETDQYLQMMADLHIFRQGAQALEKALSGVKDPKDALLLAIGFEKDSVTLYVQLKEASAELSDRISADRLISEEARHLRVLSMEYNRLYGPGKQA